MNTVQLAQRLARNLAIEDSGNLPSDAALDVLNAINAGIASFYRELPARFRRTTLSATIKAPDENIAVVFTARYENTVAADTFSTAQRGCTLRVTGGARDNEITGPSTVLDDYLGDELEVTGTVYHDAIALEYVIERLLGDVRIYYEGGGRQPRALIRNEYLRRGSRWLDRSDNCCGIWDAYGYCGPGTIGLPRYYLIDAVGASQGSDPLAYLRVAPLPPADYTLRFEAELGPRPITFAELTNAVRVPVPEYHVADMLVPLCEAELLSSPFWRDANLKTEINVKRDTVLTSKLPRTAVEMAPQGNFVGTPAGW